MTVKVSVIIPAYNAEKVISEAIGSILAQAGGYDLEILVADDRSTDGTREVVARLAQRHPQIVLLDNAGAKGPGGGRNTCLKRATGEYVAFLDADDVWLPDHLESGVSFLERCRDFDIAFFNFDIVDYETKEVVGDWFSNRKAISRFRTEPVEDGFFQVMDDLYEALLGECFIHVQSTILRKSSIGGLLFNEAYRWGEDLMFAIRLFRDYGLKCAFNGRKTVLYYRHQGSLTDYSAPHALSMVETQIRLYEECRRYEKLTVKAAKTIDEKLLARHLLAAYYNRRQGRMRPAVRHVFRSCRYGLRTGQFLELAKILIRTPGALMAGD
ncbi:UDP-Glc:alpha-D-GlcNAc-diphosphoundecaprenol beta-1,3-glucosyltransferase WfgD [Pseudodesulfovibrio hydrargyri]|uniref:UDP-Glc:alpha-D-GlcNAc-diphosphoundecaprenol beta-1,3-glucosyltransferase WfgD n=1 Tax=Pseudodesulfovibrio hydrargyri TaxID=2125990 RepID=A0A1J5N2Y9_9BACT|nr:glycosyltransferase family 2 protein [Pseudodesulfovibrio hydrargyri]OIQ49176.1 UDP-Glc:alpha-D-GlcNAc-diphosphoundecaprenol beta-1,3-glucosyltransferase WfgD [Pseudodesulfovibrio hydrargyri]